jgi:hypothetical protein
MVPERGPSLCGVLAFAVDFNFPARARLNLRVTTQLMNFDELVALLGKGQAQHMLCSTAGAQQKDVQARGICSV